MMRLSIRIQNSLIEIIKLLFIVLFVYAAVSKFLDFEHFKIQLIKSPVISTYALWLAWSLPFVELLIAGLFLFTQCTKLAFYASFFLMTLFTAYLYIVLHYSDDIPCSCGGILEGLSWRTHIIFNLMFIVLAFLGILLKDKPR